MLPSLTQVVLAVSLGLGGEGLTPEPRPLGGSKVTAFSLRDSLLWSYLAAQPTLGSAASWASAFLWCLSEQGPGVGASWKLTDLLSALPLCICPDALAASRAYEALWPCLQRDQGCCSPWVTAFPELMAPALLC